MTSHKIIIDSSKHLAACKNESIHLVVTSPPYPMIQMWDQVFMQQNEKIEQALNENNGALAFELMHQELDKTWKELYRVLIPGGFACINIGDATRTISDAFSLYSNHTRVITACLKLGMTQLPSIIWRKQINAPNKFMGSGMLPAGAYVTLEHEWILIFRKGKKRVFKTSQEKQLRYESAMFWEERNKWFSDIWDFKGTKQRIQQKNTRERSAAYPFELPYRLINMYSVRGDTILDPFLGTGTTTIAAIAAERNSIGYEIDKHLKPLIVRTISEYVNNSILQEYIQKRIQTHVNWTRRREEDEKKKALKYVNQHTSCKVVTRQEEQLLIKSIGNMSVNKKEDEIQIDHAPQPVS